MSATIDPTAPEAPRAPRPTVRMATAADGEAVIALLVGAGQWPAETSDILRGIFVQPWPDRDSPSRGFVVDAGGRVVGYCGAIYSQRRDATGAVARRVCSFSFYYVLPEHRTAALALLAAALKQGEYDFVSLSPNATSQAILPRFSFETCSTGYVLCPPLPWLPRPRARRRVLHGAARVAPHVHAGERQILDDHDLPECGHHLLRVGDRQAYVVTVRRRLEQVPGHPPVSEIVYVGDRALAAAHWRRLSTAVALADRTVGVVLDDMFRDPSHVPLGLRRPRVRMTRAGGGRTPAPDALYSELILLQRRTGVPAPPSAAEPPDRADARHPIPSPADA